MMGFQPLVSVYKDKYMPIRKKQVEMKRTKISDWDEGFVVLEMRDTGTGRYTLHVKTFDESTGNDEIIRIPMWSDTIKSFLKAINYVYKETVKEQKANKLRRKIEDEDTSGTMETIAEPPRPPRNTYVSRQARMRRNFAAAVAAKGNPKKRRRK